MVGWFVKLARAISCCFGLMLLLPLPVPPMLHAAGVASSGPALVATTNDVCRSVWRTSMWVCVVVVVRGQRNSN